MYQLVLLIPQEVDESGFDQSWPVFLNHAENMPGLIRETTGLVEDVLYGKDAFRRIYTFTFPDKEALHQALASEPGEKAGQLIHELTGGQITILITHHREDHLEHIRSYRSEAGYE
jgi:hypothetical protein